jgi:hypothetical protein
LGISGLKNEIGFVDQRRCCRVGGSAGQDCCGEGEGGTQMTPRKNALHWNSSDVAARKIPAVMNTLRNARARLCRPNEHSVRAVRQITVF